MGILLIILNITGFSLLFLFLIFSFLLLRIYYGKSIYDPSYPPVNGTVLHRLFYFNRLYDYQTEVAKKQPTFRLLSPKRSEVYTTDTRNIEHVLKTNFDKYSKGENNQDIFKDLLGQGIFSVDGENWRQQRKLAGFEFSTRVLRDYSCAVFRSNSAKMAKAVSESAVAGRVLDLQDMLMRCTLDAIFEVGFGVELNCLLSRASEAGAKFMKAFDESNALVYWRYADPFWKLKRVLNIGSEASLKKHIKVLDDFVHKLISTKRDLLAMQQQDCKEKEDILSRFIMASQKDPEKMDDQYLRDIILSFVIAGKDSSANTLSWFFYVLCKNPLIQEKIAQEVLDVTRNQENGTTNIDDFVRILTDETLEKMHYLNAALTETLRLYPAVPVNGRCTEKDDTLPDGFKLKKGDGVYYMAYAMGRMPSIWGENAEEFRPERWLENGIFQPESPFKFIAFHAGPRICLGKDFAYRQMKIVAMALIRFFRFKLADDTKHVTYKTMFTLHMDGGLHVYAISRKY